jgi:threonine aldolase
LKPHDLAAVLAERLKGIEAVMEMEIAGPGFINLSLEPAFWHRQLKEIVETGPAYGDPEMGRGESVNVEYVSANPTGPLHVAHARGAAAHMDGARLFNATVKSGIPIARRVRDFDTVSICLSKGLGAPVGSLLAGPRDLLTRGVRIRKAFGGGMRQAGIIAAAGVHALTHHVDRLADDHARAEQLAEGLGALGFQVQAPATNMVYIDTDDAPTLVASLGEAGVLCCAIGPSAVRLVTHLDVDDAAIADTLAAFAALSA